MKKTVVYFASIKLFCRYNARQYWLPATLSRYPGLSSQLTDQLSSGNHMAAVVSVIREARRQSRHAPVPYHLLRRAARSADDDVRSDVLSLICTGSRSSGSKACGQYSVFEWGFLFLSYHQRPYTNSDCVRSLVIIYCRNCKTVATFLFISNLLYSLSWHTCKLMNGMEYRK